MPSGYKLTKVPDGRAGADRDGEYLPRGRRAARQGRCRHRGDHPRLQDDRRSLARRHRAGAGVSLAGRHEGPLKDQVEQLLKVNKDLADIDQRITTTREQMDEYRARMDELHEQIFTLKAVRTAGPLMQSLEAKMQEISDKLSKATIEIVALQEKRMVARIHFQDGVADLSLDKDRATKVADKGAKAATVM